LYQESCSTSLDCDDTLMLSCPKTDGQCDCPVASFANYCDCPTGV